VDAESPAAVIVAWRRRLIASFTRSIHMFHHHFARTSLCASVIFAFSLGLFAQNQEQPSQREIAPAPQDENLPPAPAPADVKLLDAPRAMRPVMDNPKPLTEKINLGLNWLASHQLEDGGWGQGEESTHMGEGMHELKGKSNVADTCAAALSFIRAGGSPKEGQWSTTLTRALEFVLKKIEAADDESLSITDVNGTRVQGKLGPFIDTFLASLLLAESKGKMADEAGEARLASATQKVLRKIEKHQKNGVWENPGWAPVLAQSIAAKGLNRAGQSGVAVPQAMLVNNAQATKEVVNGAGEGLTDPGAAGVALYAGSANLSSLQDNVNTNEQRRDELEQVAANSPDQGERERANTELKRMDDVKKACDAMHKTILERLDDPQFIAGFGSNGGEEFISYMNIGEALAVKGGEEWKTWDSEITANMNRIQNEDGSWSGHHCITGRTFCTASALLVLMVDRTPVPVEAVKTADAGAGNVQAPAQLIDVAAPAKE
jgi:hypothetical protein